MRKILPVFQLSILMISLLASSAFAEPPTMGQEHTRVTNPDAVSIEILGRGLLYTINYDRVINDDMAAGFGFGSISTRLPGTDTDAGKTAIQIPAYFNYYFTRKAGSLYATAGVNLVTNASSVKGLDSSTGGVRFPSDSIIPTFGAGYENRGDSGYLFRIAGYGIAGKTIKPWLGFSFGVCF